MKSRTLAILLILLAHKNVKFTTKDVINTLELDDTKANLRTIQRGLAFFANDLNFVKRSGSSSTGFEYTIPKKLWRKFKTKQQEFSVSR